MRAFVVIDGFAQRRCEQARGVQRLQHVVTDGGEETGLRLLRGFGFAGAQFDTLFQRLVDVAQGLFGAFVIGDVAEAGDVTAARQRLPAHFDHLTVAAHALIHVRLSHA